MIAGLDVAAEVFRQLDPACVFTARRQDGDRCATSDVVAEVVGSAAPMLTAERTALNFLRAPLRRGDRDSPIRRRQRRPDLILGTRKTTPTLRALERYAVRAGAGTHHRTGLDDGVLIKQNHVRLAGGVAEAVRRMKAAKPEMPIEVEVCTAARRSTRRSRRGADVVMIHDMPLDDLREAIDRARGRAQIDSGQSIVVTTDYFKAEINTVGGDINHIEFLKHFDTVDRNKSFELFQQNDQHVYIAQTGLLGDDLPTHNSLFTSQKSSYSLSDNGDTVEIRLFFSNKEGTKVNKVFQFHKSSYLIDISYEIENHSSSMLSPQAYFQLVRDDSEPVGATKFVPTYTGPAVYTEKDKFQKIDFDSILKNKAKLPTTTDNGWVGMLQHYFVSAWLPADQLSREFYAKKLDNKLYSIGLILPVGQIEPGKTSKVTVPLYVGPAQSNLDKIAPGLGLTVDYGFLTIIAKPIFWLLTAIHGWVHNWGFAIIILTILIKLAFFPLSAASYRSMAKMRVVAPKLAKIKEQYGDDRERLNRAMMDLYKTEKINPLGGCLPVLIQIPVFISLYWSILASVEMRYAPFMGWITDLSRPIHIMYCPSLWV